METYDIPVWVKQFCLEDRNDPYRDWMNEPFLYHHGDELWVFATNDHRLIGYKTPINNPGFWATESMCLGVIQKPHIKSWINDRLSKQSGVKINIERLRNKIIEIISTSPGCQQCEFTLQVICSVCNGTTERNCTPCQGAGSHPCVTCNKPDACEPCEGLGVVECDACLTGFNC